MHGLIASSCFHIINHLFGATAEGGGGWGGQHWDGLRGLIPSVQVFPVPRNQTTPSLCPSLPWPMLPPSLPSSPRKLLEGISSADTTAFSLSPFSTLITSTVPQTHVPQTRAPRFSAPCLGLAGVTVYPAAQVRKLNFVSVPPSPSAEYPGHPKSFDFTTKTHLKSICSSPWPPAWSEPPSPLARMAGLRAPSLVPSVTPHTAAGGPFGAKDHGQPLPRTFPSPE